MPRPFKRPRGAPKKNVRKTTFQMKHGQEAGLFYTLAAEAFRHGDKVKGYEFKLKGLQARLEIATSKRSLNVVKAWTRAAEYGLKASKAEGAGDRKEFLEWKLKELDAEKPLLKDPKHIALLEKQRDNYSKELEALSK